MKEDFDSLYNNPTDYQLSLKDVQDLPEAQMENIEEVEDLQIDQNSLYNHPTEA